MCLVTQASIMWRVENVHESARCRASRPCPPRISLHSPRCCLSQRGPSPRVCRQDTPHRPRLGFNRARVPGANGGHRDRGDGGEPSPPHHAAELLRRDLARAGPAELVTDDRAALREQLESVTGERIAALEAVEPERVKGREAGLDGGRSPGRESDASESRERDRAPGPEMEQARVPKGIERDMAL